MPVSVFVTQPKLDGRESLLETERGLKLRLLDAPTSAIAPRLWTAAYFLPTPTC